eukprot:91039-Amorphochlora_amoeboformis.AAC.1
MAMMRLVMYVRSRSCSEVLSLEQDTKGSLRRIYQNIDGRAELLNIQFRGPLKLSRPSPPPSQARMLHRLALRSEVFQVGVLRDDLLHIRKLDFFKLVRELATVHGNVTFLKYAVWLKYAKRFLKCSERIARLYFETFLMVHRTTYRKSGAARPMLSVDLGEFILFLFIQKYSPPADGEEKNPQLQFFQDNISSILLLLRDPTKHLEDVKSQKSGIHRHEFTRLTFLLASKREGYYEELESFVSLAPFWGSKPNASVPLDTLCRWTIEVNPEPESIW